MDILGQQISGIELSGTAFGIAGVWLTVRKNWLCFPAGLVNVGLYAVLFFREKLYADASLQIVYVVLLIFGWVYWRKTEAGNAFFATRTSGRLWTTLTGICMASTLLLGTLFKNYTDASLPFLDSLLTSMSLVAQWMIAKKKLENWIIWIVADVLYVGMYIYKNLYLTSILYFIFILLAIKGYREWKKNSAVNEAGH